jgi:hypothetical protein
MSKETSERNWAKGRPKLSEKQRQRAARLLATGVHRDKVQAIFGVNQGTLYRAVPKALVDSVKAERAALGLKVGDSTKPRSGRPPSPQQQPALAAKKVATKEDKQRIASRPAPKPKPAAPIAKFSKPRGQPFTPPERRQLAEAFLKVAGKGMSPSRFARQQGTHPDRLLRALKLPDLAQRYASIKEKLTVGVKPKIFRPLQPTTRSVVSAFLEASLRQPVSAEAFATRHGIRGDTLRKALHHPECEDLRKATAKAFAALPAAPITSRSGPKPGPAPDPAYQTAAKAYLRHAAKDTTPTAYASQNGLNVATFFRALRAPGLIDAFTAQQTRRLTRRPSAALPLRLATRDLVARYLEANLQKPIAPSAFARQQGACDKTLLKGLQHPEAREVQSRVAERQERGGPQRELMDLIQSWGRAIWTAWPRLGLLRLPCSCGVSFITSGDDLLEFP